MSGQDFFWQVNSGLYMPSMLMDRFGDMLAINTSLFIAYDIDPAVMPAPPKKPVVTTNIVRLLFAPEIRPAFLLLAR